MDLPCIGRAVEQRALTRPDWPISRIGEWVKNTEGGFRQYLASAQSVRAGTSQPRDHQSGIAMPIHFEEFSGLRAEVLAQPSAKEAAAAGQIYMDGCGQARI
jgi:hypothetical protein